MRNWFRPERAFRPRGNPPEKTHDSEISSPGHKEPQRTHAKGYGESVKAPYSLVQGIAFGPAAKRTVLAVVRSASGQMGGAGWPPLLRRCQSIPPTNYP